MCLADMACAKIRGLAGSRVAGDHVCVDMDVHGLVRQVYFLCGPGIVRLPVLVDEIALGAILDDFHDGCRLLHMHTADFVLRGSYIRNWKQFWDKQFGTSLCNDCQSDRHCRNGFICGWRSNVLHAGISRIALHGGKSYNTLRWEMSTKKIDSPRPAKS